MSLKHLALLCFITAGILFIGYGSWLLTLPYWKGFTYLAIGTAILLIIPLYLKVREAIKS